MPGPELKRALHPPSYDNFHTMWNLCCYMTINKLTHIHLSANLLYDFLDADGDQEHPAIAALTGLSAELAGLCEGFEHTIVHEFFWPTKTADDLIASNTTEINAARWKPYTPEMWDQLFAEFRPEFKQRAERITLVVGRIQQQMKTLQDDAMYEDYLKTWQRLAEIAADMAGGFALLLDDDAIDAEVKAFVDA